MDLATFFDPGVYQGIVANGITMFLSAIGTSLHDSIFHKDEVKRLIVDDVNMTKLLNIELKKLLAIVEAKDEETKNKVIYFLSSQEIETMVRHYYSSSHSEINKSENIAMTEENFLSSFKAFMGSTEDATLMPLGRQVYTMLVRACDRARSIAIDKNILAAHEAAATLRFNYIKSELASLKAAFDMLVKGDILSSVSEYVDFELTYRKQVNVRYKDIRSPHFDSVKRIPIENIYIKPKFINRKDESRLEYTDVLSNSHRMVILGDPGCGKTTFTHKVAYDLTNCDGSFYFGRRSVTPFVIVMREYAVAKQEKDISILNYIEEKSENSFQVKCPNGVLEYMLRVGHVVVIFDGLDELIESESRKGMCDEIESFCNLYQSTPVIVTSRKIGYEKTPLDPKNFDCFQICDFDEASVKAYVHKFFINNDDVESTERNVLSEAFYRESEIVPDLRRNALMLSLMCNIYRGANYIPQNRPEVYKICSEMLFERWDKNRKILVGLPLGAITKPAMMHLAFHIYNDQALQKGVKKKTLLDSTIEYLLDRRYDNRDEAEVAAEEFIEFCKGRAWVFTDVGENVYQFTHRTFLEYFTACYITRNNEVSKLKTLVLEKVKAREWDVVVQLAIQIKNDGTEGAADEIIEFLLSNAQDAAFADQINILSFCCRILEFILPQQKNINLIVKQTIQAITITNEVGVAVDEALRALLSPANDNIKAITDTIIEVVPDIFETSTLTARVLDLALHLDSLYVTYNNCINIKLHEHWRNVSEQLFAETYKSDALRYKETPFTSYELVIKGKLDVSSHTKRYGASSFYAQKCNSINNKICYPSFCNLLLDQFVSGSFTDIYLNALVQIPIAQDRTVVDFSSISFNEQFVTTLKSVFQKHDAIIASIDQKSRMGFFVTIATLVDSLHMYDPCVFKEVVGNFANAYVYKAKFLPADGRKISAQLTLLGFDSSQKEFVLQWIEGKVTLLKK